MQNVIKGSALAAVAAMALAGSAQAAHFVGDYTVTANTSDPGLKISIKDLPGGIDFNLSNYGQTASEDLFRIYTTETDVGADDKVAKAIKVMFNFTSPESFGGVVSGTTVGEVTGWYQNGHVHWADPVYFNFSGGRLKVTLNDADFNGGWFGLDEGVRDSAKITANFQLLRSAAPEPTTWAMMIAGFGLAGATLRRRRQAAIAA